MDDTLTQTLRKVIREEVTSIVNEEVRVIVKEEVAATIKKELGPAVKQEVKSVIQQELKPINRRLESVEMRLDSIEREQIELRADMNDGFRRVDMRLQKQDDKLGAMLEAWSIQKIHRRELDNHDNRISDVEHHISAAI